MINKKLRPLLKIIGGPYSRDIKAYTFSYLQALKNQKIEPLTYIHIFTIYSFAERIRIAEKPDPQTESSLINFIKTSEEKASALPLAAKENFTHFDLLSCINTLIAVAIHTPELKRQKSAPDQLASELCKTLFKQIDMLPCLLSRKNYQHTINLLTTLAEKHKIADAHYALGFYYKYLAPGKKTNTVNACIYFKNAAELRHPGAHYELGLLHQTAAIKAGEKNPFREQLLDQAETHLNTAASLGHKSAAGALTNLPYRQIKASNQNSSIEISSSFFRQPQECAEIKSVSPGSQPRSVSS